mmetsp:Transcript_4933/g.14002  ORF Transcript_4933/g.14002 Transcript_4933/m.14002 type:complete len:154 (-) Transcript_4933:197-658(-)|eukprot:CAMPEP_0181040288 /NCGR_PEP_ID=MMETSP1070-20121207/10965_1 /TAXON_ID=265543 /ORGANISM="Minutocellus polymorphus, Strain NH13" /LENGTH=153 /DNA_ID=CAMNT_0023118281 /DNA_START=262 /DNA_END=723 /DNA_ORIENTATION=+
MVASKIKTKTGGAPDENVEVVLEQKQHKIISYDNEERISSVVVTPSLLLGEKTNNNVSQTTATTPKKFLVTSRTKDVRNRNIEAVKRTNARRHRVSDSFTSSVGRPPRNTYHVALQQKARSGRYDSLCRSTKTHRRDSSTVSTSRGRARERSA